MDTLNFILALLGVVLAVVGIVLVFAVERARDPSLSFEPGDDHWKDQGPFAHVAVVNRRPAGWLARHFSGTTATNCRVSFEFIRAGVSVLGPIDGRWSSAPEPSSPRDYPLSYRWDVAATGTPEQVAIAISSGANVHAFSAESYSYDGFVRPEWQLDPGEYDVVLRLESTEAVATRTFRLIVSSSGVMSLGVTDGD